MEGTFSRQFGTRYFSLALATFFLVALMAGIAVGQVTTGSLQGVVTDPNKAVVPGATVKITNVDTGQSREATTNDEGFYRVTNLQPGPNYKIEVSKQGFEPATLEHIVVHIATENPADIAFGQVAGATGTVTVTGGEQLIQPTQSQLSTAYTPAQLTQLPFNGGLIDNLALLTPGVVTPGDAAFSNGVGISANGNRGRSNNFQIDGQDNNDNSVAGPSLFLTNQDAISEFQVSTSNVSAEFGRNAGAQINVVTKSGTNEIHGTASEFLNNSRLNTINNISKRSVAAFNFLGANGFPDFTALANNRKGRDPFTYNRFGGSVGGPLKKNKAFFYVTYQRDIQRGEQTTNNFTSGGVTFTAASSAAAAALGFPGAQQILTNTGIGGGPAFVQGVGNLQVLPPLLDTNGDGVPDAFAFGGNHLAPSLVVCNVNPGVGNPCPVANRVTLFSGEAFRMFRNDYSEHQLITHEDFNLTNKDVVSIRYIYDNTKFPLVVGRALAGALFDEPSQNNNLGVTYTRNISSRTVNEARFNFSRLNVLFGDPNGTKPGPGIQFLNQRDLVFNFNSLTFGTQNNLPQSRKVDVYQEQDTVSATRGNHALKFGADLRQQKVNNFFLPNFLGTYTFNQAGTVPAAGVVCPLCTFFSSSGAPRSGSTALAFENLLLARPGRINFARGNPREITTQNDFFFFVQDDWRIRPTLTLNLGLRYELSTTPFNPLIDQLNAREASSSTAIFDTAFPLANRTATKLPLDKNNFAPRVGFAWSPNLHFLGDHFSNGRTVIRGGFGIAYDPSFFNIVLNTVTAAPFAAAGQVRQTPGAAGSVSFPFLPSTVAQLDSTLGTNGGDPRLFNQTRVDPKFHNPYTISFSGGIQQELWKNTVLEVRYVGSRLVGQFQTVTGNPDLHFLAQAGNFLFGDPTRFTNGLAVTSCVGVDPTCVAPTAAGSFHSRTTDGGSTVRITGDGRANPFFGPVRLRNNGATATYNSLQVRFDTRLRNDLALTANYTFSKNIDNASEIFSTGGGGQGVADPQRFFNSTSGERGLSAFHQKHSFTSNFIYDLPWQKAQKGAVGHLLGGYQISGVMLLGSGRAYTPLEAFGTYDPNFENAFFGVGALRPFNGNSSAPIGTIAFGYGAACDILFGGPECDYNGGTAVPGSFIIFNTARPGSRGTVVANAAAATQAARLIYNDFGLNNQFGEPLGALEAFNFFKTPFGDVGRNTFFGLPTYTVNLALFKTTRLTERTKLEFRVEAQNLLNRRNFGVPDAFTEDGSTSVGTSTFQNPGFNAGQNLQLRFGAKLIF